MGVFSTTNVFGMTVRESANDGSDFTNPAADYRRLFLGESGSLYLRDSAGAITQVSVGAGTSFPASPGTNGRFYRTDHQMEFYFDGTRWLTTQLFGLTTANNVITAINSGTRARGVGQSTTLDLWLVAADLAVGVFSTNNGSNYWTYTIDKRASNDTATTIFTADTSALTGGTWNHVRTAIGASCAVSGAFNFVIQASVKTGAPSNLQIGGGFTYRLIGT